jgi:hypothetical protein
MLLPRHIFVFYGCARRSVLDEGCRRLQCRVLYRHDVVNDFQRDHMFSM